MSTLEGVLIILAIDVIGLPALYVQIRRAMRRESERNRIVREAHERADLAAAIDGLELAYSLPAYQRPDDDTRWDRHATNNHREEEGK